MFRSKELGDGVHLPAKILVFVMTGSVSASDARGPLFRHVECEHVLFGLSACVNQRCEIATKEKRSHVRQIILFLS